jgi:uncharacterized protein (DUF4415 family)
MSETNMTRMSLDDIRKLKGKTDWDRLSSDNTESEFDEDDFVIDWASARLVVPEAKQMISLRLDSDILEFFRSQGKGYQTRMNAVLRAYKEAMEKPIKRD